MAATGSTVPISGVTISPESPTAPPSASVPSPTATTTPPPNRTPTGGSTTSRTESGTASQSSTSTSTTGDASGTGGTPQEELSSIMLDERGNTWQMQRFNSSGSASQFSRSDTRVSTMCPQESLQQTGLDDGSAIIFDLTSAMLLLNTASEFDLFVYVPHNTTAVVQVEVSGGNLTSVLISSDLPQFSSCPTRLTRDDLGIAPGVWVRNITMSPLTYPTPSGQSLWIFNSTVYNEQLTTVSAIGPFGTSVPTSASVDSGRGFDWPFVAIPLAIACALVLALFVYLYERGKRNGRHRDGYHDNLSSGSKISPNSKLSEGSASTTLLVPPSTLSLKTGFKSGSAGDKDPRALDRRSSSPLVGSPLLALPSPVAWSPASPASATSFSFQDPFADRHSTEGPIRDMGSLYAASEFIRSSSHDPSSRRTSVASLSQDLHDQSGLRRGSAATSGASSGYESYVTDQMTLVSPGGRRRSSLGSILRKG